MNICCRKTRKKAETQFYNFFFAIMLTTQDKDNLCCQRAARFLVSLTQGVIGVVFHATKPYEFKMVKRVYPHGQCIYLSLMHLHHPTEYGNSCSHLYMHGPSRLWPSTPCNCNIICSKFSAYLSQLKFFK